MSLEIFFLLSRNYNWRWKEGICFPELFELMPLGAKWVFLFWIGMYKNFYLVPPTAIVTRPLNTQLVTNCFQKEWKCHKPIIATHKWHNATRPYLHSRSEMRWGLPFWNSVVTLLNYLLSVLHKRSHRAWLVLVWCLWAATGGSHCRHVAASVKKSWYHHLGPGKLSLQLCIWALQPSNPAPQALFILLIQVHVEFQSDKKCRPVKLGPCQGLFGMLRVRLLQGCSWPSGSIWNYK